MLHSKGFLAAATAAAFALGLTACGGGGGSSLPTTGGNAPAPTTPLAQPATAQMTINIPAKTSSANHRNPKYISASTQSMTIGLVANNKTTQVAEIDLTPSSPHCTALAGGGTQCNATFVGNAGTATYALSMYSGTGGTGNLLSTGNVQATLVAGANTTVPIALDGVPTSSSVVLGVATLPVGTASSTGVFVQAKDASGNLIVGPGGFSAPITLAIAGDKYGTLSLSSTSVASPGQVVTLNYTGGTNVGSTITPNIGTNPGPATFAGSGAVMNIFQYVYTSGNGAEPYGVAALSNGTAAIEFSLDISSTNYYPIGFATPTGVGTLYVGDTTDPFHVPAPGLVIPGMTVVNGMSSALSEWPGREQDNAMTVDANNNVYYAATFSSSTPSTTYCASGTMVSGVIGQLTAAGADKEVILKGQPWYMQADKNGNVWFIEKTGTCNGTAYFTSGYAVGELPAGSSTPIQTDFASAGLTGIAPNAMSINTAGTNMYVGDDNSGNVVQIALPAASQTALVASLTNSIGVYSLATAPDDGSTVWFSDCDPADNYFYGYEPGSKTFPTGFGEAGFPITYLDSYGMSYADGSFWVGGYPNEDGASGVGRISGVASSSPIAGLYTTPVPEYDDPQFSYGISAGGGYVWNIDGEYDNIDVLQYGTPSSGVITYTSKRIGSFVKVANHPKVFPARTHQHRR